MELSYPVAVLGDELVVILTGDEAPIGVYLEMSGFLQLIKRNNAVGNRLELRAVVVIIDAHADFCRPLVRRFQLGAGRLELLGGLVVGAAHAHGLHAERAAELRSLVEVLGRVALNGDVRTDGDEPGGVERRAQSRRVNAEISGELNTVIAESLDARKNGEKIFAAALYNVAQAVKLNCNFHVSSPV